MPAADPFSRVLDEIKGQRREAPAAPVRRPANPAIQMQFVEADPQPLSRDELQGLYGDDTPSEADRVRAPRTTSTDAADIARELAISATHNHDDLHRLRRLFALDNHPDRLDPQYRDIATRRMMIANRLIDEALTRRA